MYIVGIKNLRVLLNWIIVIYFPTPALLRLHTIVFMSSFQKSPNTNRDKQKEGGKRPTMVFLLFFD